jgi:hypothetical protein
MTTIFQATLETENSDFEAFGTTRLQAKAALAAGIRRHCERYQVSIRDFRRPYEGETRIREIILGVAYRNGQTL